MDQNYCVNNLQYEAKHITSLNNVSHNEQAASLPVTMDTFLQSVEKKAYHMAMLATHSHADALDLLQDSMLKLVSNYQHRPSEQWKPLFYTILQNRIKDWYRHQKVKNLVFFWKSNSNDNNDEYYEQMLANAHDNNVPEQEITKTQQQQNAVEYLQQLSSKQQQCFLLRSWEGLSVIETAKIMGCSQGSVKTHYSRAVAKLKLLMEDDHDINL